MNDCEGPCTLKALEVILQEYVETHTELRNGHKFYTGEHLYMFMYIRLKDEHEKYHAELKNGGSSRNGEGSG